MGMSVISKETFCKVMALIREQETIDKKISDALSEVCGSYIIYGVDNRCLTALRLILKEALDDKYDYIEWWLYDAKDDFKVTTVDGKQSWDLKEPEALYDYIVNECK